MTRPGAIRAAPIIAAMMSAGLLLRAPLSSAQPSPERAAQVAARYVAACAGCHGANGQGATAPSLVLPQLKHGNDQASLARSIAKGYPQTGMPVFENVLPPEMIDDIAAFLIDTRNQTALARQTAETAASLQERGLALPIGTVRTVSASFTVEEVAKVGPAFGFAFLTNGSILISETKGALRLLRKGATTAETVADSPQPSPVTESLRRAYLDVSLHPDYHSNGWIYLIYAAGAAPTGASVAPLTLARGKLKEARWIQTERLLTVRSQFDSSARIAWGPDGFLYFGTCESLLTVPFTAAQSTPQDLTREEGKILRVTDEGKPAPGNPFLGRAGAFPHIWSYGHRVPIGLAFDSKGNLWEVENGPQGGDELNRILPGRNYGWPGNTWGHRYDYDERPWQSRPVTAGTEQPAINFSPSPALGGLAVYSGDAFPAWKGNLLIGTLKDSSLYRVVMDGDREVLRETLIHGVGRIRDIDTGPDGLVYLLFDDGTLARLTPV